MNLTQGVNSAVRTALGSQNMHNIQ